MEQGTIKWFNAQKGFGFIKPDNGGDDVFVHASATVEREAVQSLTEGQRVSFDVVSKRVGKSASNLRLSEPAPHEQTSETGTVKWFNTKKGFGFIRSDNDGSDVFVSAVFNSTAQQGLTEGQRVSYDVTSWNGNKSVANLRVLKP